MDCELTVGVQCSCMWEEAGAKYGRLRNCTLYSAPVCVCVQFELRDLVCTLCFLPLTYPALPWMPWSFISICYRYLSRWLTSPGTCM
jgi:hypothetical protein